MRASSSHLVAASLFLAFLPGGDVRAESVKNSDPQTEGERRLMEWDTTRKFVPSKSSFGGGPSTGSKSVPVSNFATRSFVSKNNLPTASFYTPEFLSTPAAGFAMKSFSTKSASTGPAGTMSKPFYSDKTAPETRSFSGSDKASSLPAAAADGSRAYLGPESEKMKQKYTPQNAPKGGVSTGHILSVEEVRGILNRNK